MLTLSLSRAAAPTGGRTMGMGMTTTTTITRSGPV